MSAVLCSFVGDRDEIITPQVDFSSIREPESPTKTFLHIIMFTHSSVIVDSK